MDTSDLFDENLVFYDLEVDTNEELLTKLSKELEERKFVKESFKDAIIERERRFPTGLPSEFLKIAIPHSDIEHVNKSCISIIKPKKPVIFSEMGNSTRTIPVDLVFVLAVNDSKKHLNVISKLINLFSEKNFMSKLKLVGNKKELFNTVIQAINLS